MNHPEETTAVILAAGGLPRSLANFYLGTTPAMVPVGGRPVIHWSLSHLKEMGIQRVVIGVNDDDEKLVKFVQQLFASQLDIAFQPVEEDRGPGGTLLACLRHPSCGNCVLVVLGDTLFRMGEEGRRAFVNQENFVLTADSPPDPERWCFVQVNPENKRARALVDKPPSAPPGHQVLIGVYAVKDMRPGMDALADSPARKLEIRDFLQPYLKRDSMSALEAEEWLDCGNIDLLLSSRRRLLNAREFNSIMVDEVNGALTKRSRNKAKLIDEINYYRLLPKDLKSFFPRVLDYSIHLEDPFLTLEYYSYQTLSEIWVFEEYPTLIWRRIFDRLREIIARFESFQYPAEASEIFRFYWQKTEDRLRMFREGDPESRCLVDSESLVINGRERLGWPRLRDVVRERLEALATARVFSIVHGDLCFPNILYDPASHAFKLIDVRGSFGSAGLYGDTRYDVAKLLHSIHGGYDFLIHDFFDLKNPEPGVYELRQYFSPSRPSILEEFKRVFSPAFDFGDLRFIEALLFLSMCPLHRDYPKRQKAMFLLGVELTNRVIQNEDLY